jgi:hypothetical protein
MAFLPDGLCHTNHIAKVSYQIQSHYRALRQRAELNPPRLGRQGTKVGIDKLAVAS